MPSYQITDRLQRSGHSTFTAASAVVIRKFLGSDEYHGNPVVVAEGTSFREPKITDPTNPNYVAGLTDKPNTGPGTPGYVPATNITLTYATLLSLCSLIERS